MIPDFPMIEWAKKRIEIQAPIYNNVLISLEDELLLLIKPILGENL